MPLDYFHRVRTSGIHYRPNNVLSYRGIIMKSIMFDRSKNPVIFFLFLDSCVWRDPKDSGAALKKKEGPVGRKGISTRQVRSEKGFYRFLDPTSHLRLLLASAAHQSPLDLRLGISISGRLEPFDRQAMQGRDQRIGSALSIGSFPGETIYIRWVDCTHQEHYNCKACPGGLM
jgi:hypothetical protein